MTWIQLSGPNGQVVLVKAGTVAALVDMTSDPAKPLTNLIFGGACWTTVAGKPADVAAILDGTP